MHTVRPAAVDAREVSFRIGGALLLDGVSLAADSSELIGLIGPNGAGKSTLLRTIAGILRPQEGLVQVDGAEVGVLSPKELASSIAVVPQTTPNTHSFTSLELVLMGRYPHLGPFQIEGARDRAIADDAMTLTETRHLSERNLDELSGGERQRVFVSRALAQQPRVLLLDEPTANLDILHQIRVFDLVRRLVGDGLTAIAAIHDLHLAARYCDRLVLLNAGRVIASGAPEQVLTESSIGSAFGVKAVVRRDEHTGALAISLIGPVSQQADDEIGATHSLQPAGAAGELPGARMGPLR